MIGMSASGTANPKTQKPKTSVYLDTATRRILAAREGAPVETRRHGRRSRILRDLLIRYDEICQRELPRLSTAEWKLLVQAGRVWAATAESLLSPPPIPSLVDTVNRTPASEGETVRAALLKKLVDFTSGQQVAVVDFVERYWAAMERGSSPPALPSEGANGSRDGGGGGRSKANGAERR